MEHTVYVFERRESHSIQWTSVSGTFRSEVSVRGSTLAKVEKHFVEAVRRELRALPPSLRFEFATPGFVYVAQLRLELVLRGLGTKRDVYGIFPFIIETRPNALGPPTCFYFHPFRPSERFQVATGQPAEVLRPLVAKAWAHLEDHEIERMRKAGKESVTHIVFDERHRTLAEFERDQAQARDPARKPRKNERPPLQELPRLAQDLTRGVQSGTLSTGKTRASIDASLRAFALGTSVYGQPRDTGRDGAPPSARSFVVVGPSGSGRTTCLRRATELLLTHDGFELTHNLDLVSHVWQLSARRVLAGMSRLGEWEKRLLRILDEARAHRAVLAFDDIALLGSIGRSRDSDRAFADLIEGPLSRGEIAVWGEATAEGFERLLDEAPRLAELLPRLVLPKVETQETYGLLLHRMRELERSAGPAYTRDGTPLRLELDPMSIPSIVQETRMLFPGVANPNKSMTILERLSTRAFAARDARASGAEEAAQVEPAAIVLDAIEERTGMPRALLDGSALDPSALEARFEADIIGQPEAARAVVDLLVRLKTRTADPSRPRAVYLFTGPTGTGKTETAKWIAKHAYGSASRLLRFDMAEYGTSDAAARLLGTGLSEREREASLTARGRAQPFSVVLFDEIEKAHRSVVYLLLQLFDEGRLTDAMGTTTDFTSAVLVMTSNLGARPKPRAGFHPSSETEAREVLIDVSRAVREFFPPELFHRMDRIVPFKPLDETMARAIVRRELGFVLERRGLTERRIAVTATRSVVEMALAEAFDVAGGARSVKGWLEERVGGLLADEIARGGAAEQRALIVYAPKVDGRRVLSVHAEAMREVEPVVETTLRMDPRWDARALRKLASWVAEPLVSTEHDVLARLRLEQRQRIGIDPRGVYALELSIQAVQAFREQHELRLEDEMAWERQRREEELDREHTIQRGRTHGPNMERRDLHVAGRIQGEERLPVGTRALRDHIGEALDLRRSLACIGQPEEHIVDVVLARSGEPREGVSALLSLGQALVESVGDVDGVVVREGASLRVLASLPIAVGSAVALRIVGTGARTKLLREHGTHIFIPDDGVPEMITVRVLDSGAVELKTSFEEVEAQTRAFREALDAGVHPLPPNPAALLPHLRTVQSQRRPDGSVDVSVEDHRAGDAFHVRARDLRAALVHFQDQRRFVLPQGLDTASLDALLASLRISKEEDAS